MQEYDVIVIGSGAGLLIANSTASHDLDTALIEKTSMGGTCLNRGCIPSKKLIHRAEVLETIKDSEKFGIEAKVNEVHFKDIVNEVNNEIKNQSQEIENNIETSQVIDLYKGQAKFEDNKVIEVNDNKITADKIVIACGTRPLIPPINGTDEVDFITNREALKLEYVPDELLIVGGGYISAELGNFFGSFGSDVTIVDTSSKLIHREDKSVSKKFTEVFSEKYNLELNSRAVGLEKKGNRKTAIIEKNNERKKIETDEILIAAGRKPNTDYLNIENTDIETDQKGFIKTDKYLRTNVENIWAIGDIIGPPMFRHSANTEAEHVAIDIIHDHKHSINYNNIPHAIFSDPQVAAVGKNEQQLEENNIEYVTGIYKYQDTAMGSALKEKNGFVKALIDPETDKILGCHIIGPHASILIHEVAVAMNSGRGGLENISNTVHAHPALNEVVKWAFDSTRN